MVLEYIEYCMLYYGALKVIFNDMYDIHFKIETVIEAKSGLRLSRRD
jgi:hypothetical protein